LFAAQGLVPASEPLELPLDEPLDDPLEDPLEDPLDEPLEDPLDEPLEDPLDEPLLDDVPASDASQLTTANIVVNGTPTHAPVATDTLTRTWPAVVQANVVLAAVAFANVPAPVWPVASLCVQWIVGAPPRVMTLTIALEPTGKSAGVTVSDEMPGHTVGLPASSVMPASTATDPMLTGAGETASLVAVHTMPSDTPVTAPAVIVKAPEPEHGSPFESVAVSWIV